jgi:predicted nucleic acid-binding protein
MKGTMAILVDSNVILDLVTRDPVWFEWSSHALEQHASEGFMTNGMIYAELCCEAKSPEEVDELLVRMEVKMAEIPRRALFLASKAHLAYRRRGGSRTTGLPDFFIGAHAEVAGVSLLTRDPGRYRTYFPNVSLLCP